MLLNNAVKHSIQESILCWLATVDAEGQPNVSPKQMFAHCDDEIIIAHIASPNSVANVIGQPKVCVSFINVFSMRGFKVHGEARFVESSKAGEAYTILHQMAGDDFPIIGVIFVRPAQIAAIIAPSYRLFPQRTVEERVALEMQWYGVQPLEDNATE